LVTTNLVRHAVPIGAGTKDVDHLVIGPGGVFAINTKHHVGASIWVGDFVLRVNNANTHHMKQALSDGRDVARRLTEKVGFPVRIVSVLAILGATSIVDKRDANNRPVSVVDADNLVAWLLARPPQLGESTLGLIKLAAEEPETWHVDPRAADTLRVMQRFERLVEQVGMPGAPPARPSRTQPTASGPRRRALARRASAPSRRPVRPSGRSGPSFGALLKLWFGTAIVLVAILVFRSIANQPCTTGICLVPLFYQGLKPLLVLGVIASIGIGAIGTLIWIVRRAANR